MRQNRREELKNERNKKSKSQYRNGRPPLANNKIKLNNEENEIKDHKRTKNSRIKKLKGQQLTDAEDVKKQSKIPRLSKASIDKIPLPKKYIPESDYKPTTQSEKKPPIRRSQSFLKNVASKPIEVANGTQEAQRIMNSVSNPMQK